MKQNIIYIISLIAFCNLINAGVIREEKKCTDIDGNEIPCIKVIEKKEDFGLMGKKKRQWGNNWNNAVRSNGWEDVFSDKNDRRNSLSGLIDSLFNNRDDSWWDLGNWWNKNNNNNNNGAGNGGIIWINNNQPPANNPPANNPPPVNNPPINNPPPANNPPVNNPPPANNPPPNNPPPANNPPPNNTNPSGNPSPSLPIKDLTMTDFGKCDQRQADILRGLIEDIKTYRAAAVYVLNNQNEDEMYKKIFLKYYKDNGVLQRVQRTFGSVNDMATIRAFCEPASDKACSEGALAWTYLNSREYHVCPTFFTEAMFGTIAQRASEGSSIVLHEMTHCFGTEDYAYGEMNSGRLQAAQASNNADTFRLFAMSSIYYLNEKGKGLIKRSDDFLNQNVDFRVEPFMDKLIIRRSDKKKRSDEDFLNQNIDFRAEPLKDKVVERPNDMKKRSDEDFLNQNIDFRAEPLKDKVVERPNGMKKRSDEDFLNQNIDFRAEPLKDKVVERPNGMKKRSDEDFLNQNIDFRAEPFKDKVVERPN